MGFYSVSTITQGAKLHGLKFCPMDAQLSKWDCTLEALSKNDAAGTVIYREFWLLMILLIGQTCSSQVLLNLKRSARCFLLKTKKSLCPILIRGKSRGFLH
jgi:hypothetical protein